MAASQGPVTTTASRCTPETARGSHLFEIAGYSLLKGLGVGDYIDSAPFTVGGHEWCVSFSPNGDEEFEDHASVFLVLRNEPDAKVRALYDLRMLNPATGVLSSVYRAIEVFDGEKLTSGAADFMERSELEASYLRNDRLLIECDVTVIMGTPVSEPGTICEIQVPPSDVLDSLGKLLDSAEGTDVTFKVEVEVFHAHKLVLAMRSPVFKAELYGPMSDKGMETIAIEDMQPAVFKALLHFIYKDSLPVVDELDGDENIQMVKHLLVAADRYAVERLKVMCESILCKRLDVESTASILALADQHHCSQLRDACIQFISSLNRIDDVVASEGYEHLKRACPSVIVEIWEKSAKSRRI